MEIFEITSKEEYQKYWNELNLHVLQSWEWGEIKSDTILRLGLREAEKVIAILSVHQKSLIQELIKFGYSPKAFIPQEHFKQAIEKIKEYIKHNTNNDFILFDFDIRQENEFEELKSLQNAGKTTQPQATNMIDLTKTENELFDEIRKKYKQHQKINRAKKLGVEVSSYSNGQEPFDKFFRVIEDIYFRTKYVMYNKLYFEKIWNKLNTSGKVKIYLAQKKGELLGAYLAFLDNKGIYELYGGANSKGREFQAGHMLKWQAMMDAKSIGKKYYDQWGVAKKLPNREYDTDDELFNITRFKDGFGGEYVEFVEQKVLVINNFKFLLYKLIRAANQVKLRVLKRFK